MASTKHPEILLYCVLDRQGGIETHIKNLVSVLTSKGAKVTVAAKWVKSADRDRQIFQDMGARFVHPAFNLWLQKQGFLPPTLQSLLINLVADLWFRIKLRSKSFDLVSINATGMFGARLRRYCKSDGGRITYHEHQTLAKPIQVHSAYARMLQSMHFMTVNSRRDADTARALFVEPGRVVVMPALAAPASLAASMGQQIGQPFRVGFIGNVAAREKGARKLLDIWRNHRITDMSLTFYGPNPESLGSFTDLPMVRTAGSFQPQSLSQVFDGIDLLVHPADDESLGLVLIEAMAHGVPFVGTHVGGIIDIAKDNPHVLTVDNDEAAIFSGIQTIRRRMTDGVFDRVALQEVYRSRWSHEALGQRWVDQYFN
jgi:glycosyltransferase involved in cell wall biosynthesis